VTPPDLAARKALMARLPRTWPAFFARHGSFTAAQLLAIPPLLDGENVLLCAPTASGKTAAVLAALLERHCPPAPPPPRPAILYLTPTRALVNDLLGRLQHPLDTLGLSLGAKTRDTSFDRARPPVVLLATPESTDALLAADARLFAGLRALVIDELHLFDGTPRGDQLRVLLSRIRRVRDYAARQGDAPDALVQYAALSATLPEPQAVAQRYIAPARVLEGTGGRAIEAELLALDGDDLAGLRGFLESFRARGWRKALVFCNSRAEIESYAAGVRAASVFGQAVFTHYSNLEPGRRLEIEREFAGAGAAICFTSSTLELGIDIGSIDVVVLIGPPGNVASFAQRIGRGNRRGDVVRVVCCFRMPLEEVLFRALLDQRPKTEDQGADLPIVGPSSLVFSLSSSVSPSSFRPSVAVQQIFSLLKQSPTAAVRLAELAELFAGMLGRPDLTAILGHLERLEYLTAGRPGEWRAGRRLHKLYDEQGYEHVPLSIYSNITISAMPSVAIRDQHTQRTIATVDAHWLNHESLTLEGRPVSVTWHDGEALWVSAQPHGAAPARAGYHSGRQLLGYELAQRLSAQLGLSSGSAPFIQAPDGYYWFHWLGDLYGRAALDLLRYTVAAQETAAPGLALLVPDPPQAPPQWSAQQVTRYLHDAYLRYEALLDLGPFQHLLPRTLRRRAVAEQFDVPRFLGAVAALQPVAAPEASARELGELLDR
jgi:ATP-dependent helicase Lhr and Lhr-like helicase